MGLKMPRYPASDEFIVWAQSLSGMLTRIKTEYGGITELVERPEWDDAKTQYALSLIGGLSGHLSKMHAELADHVTGKTG